MANKKRLNEIASEFGEKKDISIFLGREKIYPGKEISDQTLERLENALRSPESEQGSLRVQEGKVLIYQSAKGELKLDTKGAAASFQPTIEQVESLDAAKEEYETLLQDVPETLPPKERDDALAEVALAQQVTPEQYMNLLAHSAYTQTLLKQGTPVEDVTREYLAPKMRDYLIAQQQGTEPLSREPAGALVLAQSKQLIPIPVSATQPELDQAMSETLNSSKAMAAVAYQDTINAYQAKLDRSPLSFSFDEIKSGAAQSWDKLFTDAALAQGMSKDEFEQVFCQSPYVQSQIEAGQSSAEVAKDYIEPAVASYDSRLQAQHTYLGALQTYQEAHPTHWAIKSQSLSALRETAQYPHVAQDMDLMFMEGAQRQGLSQEEVHQTLSHSPYVQMQLEAGQSFDSVSRNYIEPLVAQHEQTVSKAGADYERLAHPPEATNFVSMAPVAADVSARIDALQAQLDETKAALQDLSQQVTSRKFGTWASTKAQEISKTSQVIAEQTKSRVAHWMSSKVTEVKSFAQERISEGKSLVSEGKSIVEVKVDEFSIRAQLKAIEVKEALREKVNELLAPVNVQKLETSARYVIEHYGDGQSYDKAATHSFRLDSNNELSISRHSDKAVVFERGQLTKAADSRDVWKLNTLPDFVAKVNAAVAAPQQLQEAEMG